MAAGISLFPSWPWLVAGLRAPLAVVPLSCEAAKAPVPKAVFPELQRSVESISEMIQLVVDIMAKFKGEALLAPCCASPGLGWQWEFLTAWCLCLGSGAKRLLQMGTIPEMGFARAWPAVLMGSRKGATGGPLVHLPFLLPVNLRSEIDGERGKFLELMSKTEGENFSRMNFLLSLVQR